MRTRAALDNQMDAKHPQALNNQSLWYYLICLPNLVQISQAVCDFEIRSSSLKILSPESLIKIKIIINSPCEVLPCYLNNSSEKSLATTPCNHTV